MRIKITPNDRGNPPGKLADAELHFEPADGPLSGLKLIGFSIWERRGTLGGRNVTFPARQYSVNGERRSFALLRPIEHHDAQSVIRDRILESYAEYEAAADRTIDTSEIPELDAQFFKNATLTRPGENLIHPPEQPQPAAETRDPAQPNAPQPAALKDIW